MGVGGGVLSQREYRREIHSQTSGEWKKEQDVKSCAEEKMVGVRTRNGDRGQLLTQKERKQQKKR